MNGFNKKILLKRGGYMYTIYIYWYTGDSDKCEADTYEECMKIASGYKFSFGSQIIGYYIVKE